MKKLAILSIVACVAGVAFGQAKMPTTIKCAVMQSNKVNIADATKHHQYADYKGRRYYFCCGSCPKMFAKNPAKFAKSASTAIPKKA